MSPEKTWFQKCAEVQCPECRGKGILTNTHGPNLQEEYLCYDCNGTGLRWPILNEPQVDEYGEVVYFPARHDRLARLGKVWQERRKHGNMELLALALAEMLLAVDDPVETMAKALYDNEVGE